MYSIKYICTIMALSEIFTDQNVSDLQGKMTRAVGKTLRHHETMYKQRFACKEVT